MAKAFQTRYFKPSLFLSGVLFTLAMILSVSMGAKTAFAETAGLDSLASDLLLQGTQDKPSTDEDTTDNQQQTDGETITDKNSLQKETTTVTTNHPIETDTNPPKDEDIRQRIMGIFSEIDGLKTLKVSVNQGVVTLSGDVPNEKKAQQAINLTNRIGNVVAVNDGINRTLDVEDNITPVVNTLKNKATAFIKALPLLLMALLVFAIIAWFGRWFANRNSFWQKITPNPFVAELLSQTVQVIFIVIGLILALSLLGAEAIIGTLLGGAGVIGIAVGFAVKDTIENYIASLMLSIRQPFRARDQVAINDHEGIVVRLTSRATILMTFDGNQLRIPNSEVFKGTILNYSKNPERRFTFELGVDANDDPLAGIKVGLDAVNDLDFVLAEPKAVGVIKEVGDSNIVLEFKVWVNQNQTDYSKARSIAIREAKHALENQGFSLPEPMYRLRFQPEIEQSLQQLVSPSHQGTNIQASLEPDYKAQAKQRAKQVLQNADTSDILDARPDTKLMEKVEEEIAESADADLLDTNSPQE